jgi:hypothetical protein
MTKQAVSDLTAITPRASNVTVTRIDGTAALFIERLISALCITRIEIKESVIYTAKATGLVEWGRLESV